MIPFIQKGKEKNMKENYRIETLLEIQDYLDKLKFSLENGATITFQRYRKIDEKKDEKYTNAYTIDKLFPNEEASTALKRELKKLTVQNYIKTVRDLKFPNRSEMREFGKVYEGEDVYIKIRVELLDSFGQSSTFVMSFHFAEKPFDKEIFPYKIVGEDEKNENNESDRSK